MIKKISYILYSIIKFLDNLFVLIAKKSFLVWFKEFLQNDSYKSIQILNQKIIFFIPSEVIEWRVNTYFTKEPETLDWIDNFDNSKKFTFWDIGANIGLYSIYAALKHGNCDVVSFEPSTSNLRTLSRNISINNLENRIKIFTNPLSNKTDEFSEMRETQFIEGGALNSFGENYNFEGKKFKSSMTYQLMGKSINSILDNKILEVPSYIKLDVDGIEHLILKGAQKYLNHNNLLSLSIEINEDFTKQFQEVLKIMKDSNFKVLYKKHNEEMFKQGVSSYANTYNYVFVR